MSPVKFVDVAAGLTIKEAGGSVANPGAVEGAALGDTGFASGVHMWQFRPLPPDKYVACACAGLCVLRVLR